MRFARYPLIFWLALLGQFNNLALYCEYASSILWYPAHNPEYAAYKAQNRKILKQ